MPPILSDKIPATTRPPELKIAKIPTKKAAWVRLDCLMAIEVIFPISINPAEEANAYISQSE